ATPYAADTWLGEMSMGASRDGGKTWTGTSVSGPPIADRPWLVGGAEGVVHLAYQDVQFGMPTAIWYVRSSDYGQSFSTPVLVARPAPDRVFSWEGNLVASSDGKDLYLVYNARSTALLFQQEPTEDVTLAASHGGGA